MCIKANFEKAKYILLSLFLVGCATSRKVALPSGEKGYTINCDSSMVYGNVCYEKAGELCPNGYEIHNEAKNSGWPATNSVAGSTTLKGIVIRCSDPKPKLRKEYIPEKNVEINEETISIYQKQVGRDYEALKSPNSNSAQRNAAK